MAMNVEKYCFVELNKEDLPFVLDISKDIILNTYVSFLGKDAVTDYIKSRLYENEIIPNIQNCIVMKHGEIVIGFSILLENKLHLIMIDRKHQNQKLGTKLLNHVEKILFTEYSIIELQSFADNTIANTFYEKNGWLKTGEINMNELLLYKYEKAKTA
jgi:ribosomal protein S18 acetylase RimI-like enzyme